VAHHELSGCVVRVKHFFIRRKDETVWGHVVFQKQSNLALLDHVNSRVQLAPGVFVSASQAAKSIRKVNGAIFLDDNVVGTAEPFSIITTGDGDTLAVLFDSVN